jgi:hypothetical protein
MSATLEPESSWQDRELVFELPSGKGELYSQKNKSDDTRKKILHIKGLIDREVIGEVNRVHYGTYDGKPACLFVARFKFRWHRNAFRFRKIETIFTAANREGSTAAATPKLKVYSPKHMFGLWSTEHREFRFDIALQCSISVGTAQVQLGQVSVGRTRNFDRDHALEISGMDWQGPEDEEPNSVIFTVDENEVQDTGVPKEMFFGMIFENKANFQIDVQMDVSDFRAWPWSKDDPILLGSGRTLGNPPRTLEFDKLTDADWQELVPYRAEREVLINKAATMNLKTNH